MKTQQIISLSIICSMVLAALWHFSTKEEVPATDIKPLEKVVQVADTYRLQDSLLQLFKRWPDFMADGFDFPVGKPHAKGYYNAQPFGKNLHLGDDWNAKTGGNTDLGDPIYAIGDGLVWRAWDYRGGWGQVIWMVHCLDSISPTFIVSLYAHCEDMKVKRGQWIKKGEKIGTIGNVDGRYLAHLHLEIRDDLELPLGGGYSQQTKGYLDPTQFITANR